MATQFVQQDNIDHPVTAEGQQVLDYLESYLSQWEEKVGVGSLPGHIGYYYANVLKLKTMTAKQWLLEYPNQAEAVLSTVHIEEQKRADRAALAATQTGQSELERQLAAFKEEVAKQVAALQAENAALREAIANAGKATENKPAEPPAKKGKA